MAKSESFNNSPFFEIVLLIVSICGTMLIISGHYSARLMVEFNFIVYVLLLVLNYIRTQRITLFQIWLVAYLYIIWSEMMVIVDAPNVLDTYYNAIAFLLFANDTLLLGYEVWPKSKKALFNNRMPVFRNRKTVFVVLILTMLFYFVSIWQKVLDSMSGGRQLAVTLGGTTATSILSDTLGLMIPAIAVFYYKYLSNRTIWCSFLWLLPIAIIQVLLGTRYRILFSLLPALVIMELLDVRKMTVKKGRIILLVMLLLVSASSIIKVVRNYSLKEMAGITLVNTRSSSSFLGKAAQRMSPEGIVEMTVLSNQYFSNHELMYGREVSYLLYFWVPRKIWPNKPTPIDHWLIRQYENVADTSSTASGFTGELRADFGMFCFIILFLWGGALSLLDHYSFNVFSIRGPNVNKILASMLYPWVFFCVRSPITSSTTFICQLVIFFLLKRFCTYYRLTQ